MNLGRIMKKKGIEFLESIPELDITMIKKSDCLFFTKMMAPIRSFGSFEIFMLTEGDNNYVNCGSLYCIAHKRSMDTDVIGSLPIAQIGNRINLIGQDYENDEAKTALFDYVFTTPCIDMSYSLPSSFLQFDKLGNIDPFLENLGLTGADIVEDIENFLKDVCERMDARATKDVQTTPSLSDDMIQELLSKITEALRVNNDLIEKLLITRELSKELSNAREDIKRLLSKAS